MPEEYRHHGPGLLFALEGLDGCGKSTQLRLLAQALTERGYPVTATREPSDGPYGQQLRSLLAARHEKTADEELALFLADRRDHVARVINPALAQGRIVLTDRYFLSTAAYQGARGFDPEQILVENEGFAPIPERIFLLEIPVAEGVRRIRQGRGERPNDFEGTAYLEQVAAVFQRLDRPYIQRLDGTRPVVAVAADLLSAVLARLAARGWR